MRWIVMVLIMVMCILLVICYALCVIASQADEDEEKFYKEWKEKDDGKAVQSADE